MRPHWNRNHPRNVEAANDRLRQRYEDRRQHIGTAPSAVPDKLTRAIRDPRWSGEPVLVTAGGRDVAAVLGTESTDAWAIWRDITAAVQVDAVQADEDTGTGVRLIAPAPFAEGLRAVAIAAVAIAVAGVLFVYGQTWHLNQGPSSPAGTATRHATAGIAPTAASRGSAGRRRSSRPAAGGHAPSRHRGTGTVPAAAAPTPGRAAATQPQPSPVPASSSPSPSPSARKKCALSVLGVCVSRD